MSEIVPPNISGSAAQAGYVQSEASRARNAARSGGAGSGRKNIKSLDDAGDTIETSDGDAQVFTDAEGEGGQGRAHDEASHEHADQDARADSSGVTLDDEGHPHLDIEA